MRYALNLVLKLRYLKSKRMRQLTYTELLGKFVSVSECALHLQRIKHCLYNKMWVGVSPSAYKVSLSFCILSSVTAITIINGHLSAAIAITLLAIYSNTRSQLMHKATTWMNVWNAIFNIKMIKERREGGEKCWRRQEEEGEYKGGRWRWRE